MVLDLLLLLAIEGNVDTISGGTLTMNMRLSKSLKQKKNTSIPMEKLWNLTELNVYKICEGIFDNKTMKVKRNHRNER